MSKQKKTLTDTELRVLRYIDKRINDGEEVPTHCQMAKDLGFPHTGYIAGTIASLHKGRYITKERYKRNSIRLTMKGTKAVLSATAITEPPKKSFNSGWSFKCETKNTAERDALRRAALDAHLPETVREVALDSLIGWHQSPFYVRFSCSDESEVSCSVAEKPEVER